VKGKSPKAVTKRRPPRALELRRAGDAIEDALAFHGITDRVRAERVLAEWTELVGPKIGARTRPYGIEQRLLLVEVATSAWLHELNLLRAQIVANLLERIGEPRLFDDLAFRLAGRSRDQHARPE
jgi:predicted nucleic acid-binding Zn ribbon protein